MARPRLELQQVLKDIVPNVYFQPPNGLSMTYPCIIYARDTMDVSYADNGPYRHAIRYEVTVVDQNPDSEIVQKVANLPLTSHNRFFTSDNLNHDVFTLYF
ncbi:tail terminator [Gordonia phage Hydrus]|nr:tail terminator [Gordonia phage Hydrus]